MLAWTDHIYRRLLAPTHVLRWPSSSTWTRMASHKHKSMKEKHAWHISKEAPKFKFNYLNFTFFGNINARSTSKGTRSGRSNQCGAKILYPYMRATVQIYVFMFRNARMGCACEAKNNALSPSHNMHTLNLVHLWSWPTLHICTYGWV